jgi:hypothetical protein
MQRTFRHHDPRFTVTMSHAYWGGRRYVTVTVYLVSYGRFCTGTRNTAKAAYRAADHAIRFHQAKQDYRKYTRMRELGLVG